MHALPRAERMQQDARTSKNGTDSGSSDTSVALNKNKYQYICFISIDIFRISSKI